LVLYDLTNKESLDDVLPLLYKMYTRKMFTWLPVILCGTKSDLSSQREISSEEIQVVSKHLNIGFFEISSKTGENVQEIFLEGVRRAKNLKSNRKKYKKQEYGWRKKMKDGKYNWLWLPCLCVSLTLVAFIPWAIMMILASKK